MKKKYEMVFRPLSPKSYSIEVKGHKLIVSSEREKFTEGELQLFNAIRDLLETMVNGRKVQ